MLAILKAQVRRINSSIIGSERGKTMITDSFDNKTEPIFTLKDFYGERRKNHEKIADIFKELHFPYVKGRIWTTDAFLRETAGQIAIRQQEGCIAVDMEVAGMQSVCDFHGFDLYNFLVTGDVLSEDKYEMERFNDANHNLDKFYIALEIAKRI